jgi:hypothetical protein
VVVIVFFFGSVGGSRQGAYACTGREKKRKKVGTGFVEKKNLGIGFVEKTLISRHRERERERERERD